MYAATETTKEQGAVTFMDSVVTTATAVGQWSMVKAHSEVWLVLTTAGHSAEWLDSYARATDCSLSLEHFSANLDRAASFRKIPRTINGKNCKTVQGQRLKMGAYGIVPHPTPPPPPHPRSKAVFTRLHLMKHQETISACLCLCEAYLKEFFFLPKLTHPGFWRHDL